ncbi:alpha/beta fold hydrolase [Ruegeria atlantica]|uniref:Pimelyl-[acyl-carrier protein] methyl ester esterase n=1 Tax=Ruegeria atlantica TaxID=81569 RepID=A0A0P1EC45_9RHOB|nr:alpha/beta fold hydrolase [Ruegeria atlantica]CUH47166.1 Pimelyl-[acyl-carrier protein] methyl ester esterase [Ruegeria atlantica]
MTPLVLIPGMMCDARLFGPQIASLSGKRDVHLASLARPGGIVDIALAFLETAPPRFALCGLSMGGIVAMEILRQAPDRVDRIALLDTNPLAERDDVKQRRLPQMQAVREGDLAGVMRDEMKPNYLAEGPRRSDVLDLCMKMALDLGAEVFLRQSQALMDRGDQTKTLAKADLPALVLCGRHDTLCPVARHEFMAGLIPNAHLEIIDDAGHLPTLEQPLQTTAALIRWLEA